MACSCSQLALSLPEPSARDRFESLRPRRKRQNLPSPHSSCFWAARTKWGAASACNRWNVVASGQESDATQACELHTQGDAGDAKFRAGRRFFVLSATALSLTAGCGVAFGENEAAPDPLKNLLGSLPDLGNAGVGAPEKQSRVYDATALGEPSTVGGDRSRVWEKLLAARVVYLGEAEVAPDPDDKLLELEIVKTLQDKSSQQQRRVSVAFECFPRPFQPRLDQYVNKELTIQELKILLPELPEVQWQQFQPLLEYCRNNGVGLVACGTPAEVLRTIQTVGVQGLSEEDRRTYIPRFGTRHGGFPLSPALSSLLQQGSLPFVLSRMVEENSMAQVVAECLVEGGASGLLVVITGASHVEYGSKGSGVPARVSKKLQKRKQAVVLLNPERQWMRNEGDVPQADFLWYAAAKGCTRNCFNRAEVARVMETAGRSREALPQDIQAGIDQGLVSPEVLQSFFELDDQPLIAELTRRFEGVRERWLADPRFLQRLAIEESISITTTLIAQYERRGPKRFWQELEYVITDSVRGAVVDFFTVWLPAPRLSFRKSEPNVGGFAGLEGLQGLLGSVPENAFQRARLGENWDLHARGLAVLVGGLKLFGVGFISSVGTVTVTNGLLAVRQAFSPDQSKKPPKNRRSPIFKTALVYGGFLGTSANLRYQAIAGLVEHWIADYLLASQPLAGNVLSFIARTANSYWGTQQWVDLARFTGLQAHNDEESPKQPPREIEESGSLDDDDVVLGQLGKLEATSTSLEALIGTSEQNLESSRN